MGTLIHCFDKEHHGPVRSVHFHHTQPLFVSGGDDHKIKVWNYKLHQCLFTLLGHTDYIRTVQFHHEKPWIVSASDDYTIMIWNWQSRTCISTLTGHNHYVMCASFHPKEDLVVSASLDQTVRVWDISALKKQSASAANDDILGTSQVGAVVKYVMAGHDRGLPWASFHPTLPLIVSGSDDHQVKIWRMNDTTAWEVDTLRGHTKNVSCVLFHARQDIIISNSEDKSLRVWDATERTCLQTFRREHDRFWILACHPEINLLAAGHDSGMIVFKLERERPAFSVSGDSLYYVKERLLWLYEYSSQKDTQIIPISSPGPRTVSYSSIENAILICSDVDGGSYELYNIPKDGSGKADTVQEAKRGVGASAVFVARNRFAVLEQSTNQVLVKNLENETVKTSDLPVATDAIFYASTGNLLCRAEDKVFIFDLQRRLVLGDLQASFVRYVVWSNDMESVALLSKNSIVIADKKLVHRCTLHETFRVKSGSWDDNGVFIYTTVTHIKYCLPNGESGVVRTLDVPVYITKVFGNTLFCLDRDGNNRPIVIDSTEYILKLSLLTKRYDHVISITRNSDICGQAMIAYLQQKGFPEVALHFVKDEKTRFNLALESGNIEIAVASAKEIDEKDFWYRLGVEALRQGNAGIVENAYQRAKNFERLSFLYLITGNLDKLSKMMKIAEVTNDVMGQFHNALYLGDVQERIKILVSAGHLPLAYATAKTHGLNDVAEDLAEKLEGNIPCLPGGRSASLLVPPTPVLCGGDWPLLNIIKRIFEVGPDNAGQGANEDYDDDQNGDISMVLDDEESEEESWDLEDLELPPNVGAPSVFVAPTPGMPLSQILVQNSSLAAEHAAAGNFDTAMQLLSDQLGIRNFTPLKSLFIDLHMGSHTYLCAFSSAPLITLPPCALVFKFSQLEEKLEAGKEATTTGKFTKALRLFMSILHTIPLIVVESIKEVDKVKEVIIIVKEYVLGCQMELKRRELKDNPVRQQELAAYFTHCNLEPRHLGLALMNAMIVCYKAGNLITASNFARRLLETPTHPNDPTDTTAENQMQKARAVMQATEKNMTDKIQLNYDFRNPFVVCGATYVPIYRGQRDVVYTALHTSFFPRKGSFALFVTLRWLDQMLLVYYVLLHS